MCNVIAKAIKHYNKTLPYTIHGRFATLTVRLLDISPPVLLVRPLDDSPPWTICHHVMDKSPPNSNNRQKFRSKALRCGCRCNRLEF